MSGDANPSTSFDMTDQLATRAAREHWRAVGRRLFTPGALVITAASAALFALALRKHASAWWLLLSGTGPSLLAIVATGWLTGFWWAPRAMRRRLARLPHRTVTLQCTPASLVFQTATERLELAWSEVALVDQLRSFWLFRLKSGAVIPVPRATMSPDFLAAIERRGVKT